MIEKPLVSILMTAWNLKKYNIEAIKAYMNRSARNQWSFFVTRLS